MNHPHNPTGSNTKDPLAADASTATYAIVKAPDGNDQFTFLEGTPSPLTSTPPTNLSLEDLEPESQPPTFKPPLPVDSLAAANLPRNILASIRHSFPTAHFVAVAPNAASCLITAEAIADIPLGYVVVLVFDPVDGAALPPTHQTGQVYIIPSGKGDIIPSGEGDILPSSQE